MTAAWTVLVAIALRDRVLARVLSAVGTVEPLGVLMAGLLDVVGYIVWSAWLVAFAVRVLVVARRERPA